MTPLGAFFLMQDPEVIQMCLFLTGEAKGFGSPQLEKPPLRLDVCTVDLSELSPLTAGNVGFMVRQSQLCWLSKLS